MDDGLEGYYVGTSENPTTIEIEGLNITEMKNLYVISDKTNARAYWFGSPSADNTSLVMRVNCDGLVSDIGFTRNSIGLRPLVSLPSGITLVEQENGTYDIKGNV